MQELQKTESSRIPSLDGARAISIALVVAAHSNWNKTYPIIWRVSYGNLGVRVFFVISGFLITTLLLQEQAQRGRISIGHFYIRRAFRILPAAYIFLAIVMVLIPFGVHALYKDTIPVFFYYADYRHPGSYSGSFFGQFWSLSVEEQFYFLWPTVLVLLGTRRAWYACAALLLIAPTFRMLTDLGLWHTYPGFAFECVSDALATGCMLALLREPLWTIRSYRRVVEGWAGIAVAIAGLALSSAGPPVAVRYVIGIPLLNFGIAILLDRYMRMPASTAFGRFLNLAPVVWLGGISYSLYVWQQPWMFTTWPRALRIAGALSCAVLSFYLVERPMLKLRGRVTRTFLARSKTSRAGPKNLNIPLGGSPADSRHDMPQDNGESHEQTYPSRTNC